MGAGAMYAEKNRPDESIEGHRGEPRFTAFPGVAGLWQQPTVVNNVETLPACPILC